MQSLWQILTTVTTTVTQTISAKIWNKGEEMHSQNQQLIHSQQHMQAFAEPPPPPLKQREFKGLINNQPHITILLGRKGSGKTSLLIELLRTPGGFHKKYSKVFIISATYVSQFEKSWSKISREGVEVFSVLSDSLLLYIEKEAQKHKGESFLIISDDMDESWRKSVDPQIVNRIISNSRHTDLSFVYLSQSCIQLPTIVRRNCDVYVLFGACSYAEIQLIWGEVSCVPRKDFWSMFETVTKKPYGFLVCCIQKGKIVMYDSFRTQLH